MEGGDSVQHAPQVPGRTACLQLLRLHGRHAHACACVARKLALSTAAFLVYAALELALRASQACVMAAAERPSPRLSTWKCSAAVSAGAGAGAAFRFVTAGDTPRPPLPLPLLPDVVRLARPRLAAGVTGLVVAAVGDAGEAPRAAARQGVHSRWPTRAVTVKGPCRAS